MFRNKKGFTLIELLAVIVILAILALIAVPIVLNIINNAQKGADKVSVRKYAEAVEAGYYSARINEPELTLDEYIADLNSGARKVDKTGDDVSCASIFVTEYDGVKHLQLENCTVAGRKHEFNYVKGEVVDSSSDSNNTATDSTATATSTLY